MLTIYENFLFLLYDSNHHNGNICNKHKLITISAINISLLSFPEQWQNQPPLLTSTSLRDIIWLIGHPLT